ncbi:hypothetical protein [Oceanicoccus sagamiensis]|uniref:PEP-CTERM protein-sorting domain-containing protein n=1 Tax=Oceanicoccus sagamiensis TaxID=716816 RepID=A0A1X9N9I1_9GAMM|nr:hypothetical protein [Oceanicoccus sagamiensis]ARN73082.1 hypothetical protein BST96_02545 [Oceanicoccus sagamiensis]
MKFTNKKLLAAAVLTAIATQANAAPVTYTVTSSTVTADLFFGTGYVGAGSTPGEGSTDPLASGMASYQGNALPDGGYAFNISGTVTYDDADGSVISNNLKFNGGVTVDVGGELAYAGFLNAGGDYVNGSGLTLNTGLFDATFGAYPEDMVDLTTTNLDFTVASFWDGFGFVNPGFILETGAPITAGDIITLTMPGYTHESGFNQINTVGNVSLFGEEAGMGMGGTLTLEVAAVPVPAAAWLFGSAIVGLAGIGRKRKSA